MSIEPEFIMVWVGHLLSGFLLFLGACWRLDEVRLRAIANGEIDEV